MREAVVILVVRCWGVGGLIGGEVGMWPAKSWRHYRGASGSGVNLAQGRFSNKFDFWGAL